MREREKGKIWYEYLQQDRKEYELRESHPSPDGQIPLFQIRLGAGKLAPVSPVALCRDGEDAAEPQDELHADVESGMDSFGDLPPHQDDDEFDHVP